MFGSSCPPAAALTALTVLAVLAACAPDPCDALCAAAVPAYADCLAGWDAEWPDAGYADAADFEDACRTWAWERRLMEREIGARGDTDAVCTTRSAALRERPTCATWMGWDWNEPLEESP